MSKLFNIFYDKYLITYFNISTDKNFGIFYRRGSTLPFFIPLGVPMGK